MCIICGLVYFPDIISIDNVYSEHGTIVRCTCRSGRVHYYSYDRTLIFVISLANLLNATYVTGQLYLVYGMITMCTCLSCRVHRTLTSFSCFIGQCSDLVVRSVSHAICDHVIWWIEILHGHVSVWHGESDSGIIFAFLLNELCASTCLPLLLFY